MPGPKELTHLDARGAARMVDVGGKAETRREASAECVVRCGVTAVRALRAGNVPKGDALAVARVAAIMAAKKTPELIPLCHPLPITAVEVDFTVGEAEIRAVATVRVTGKTGVEMEALTAAAAAGLTLIDMLKAIEKGIELEVRLLTKSGGRTGSWERGGRRA